MPARHEDLPVFPIGHFRRLFVAVSSTFYRGALDFDTFMSQKIKPSPSRMQICLPDQTEMYDDDEPISVRYRGVTP